MGEKVVKKWKNKYFRRLAKHVLRLFELGLEILSDERESRQWEKI